MTPSVDTPQGGCLRLFVGRCILFSAADGVNLSSCCLFSLSLSGQSWYLRENLETDAGVQIRRLKTGVGREI